MGLNMYLYKVTYDFNSLHEETMTFKECGYWRKAYIIAIWFDLKYEDKIKEWGGVYLTLDGYMLKDLIKDCEDTIKYYDKYEQAHRNNTREQNIPSNCLLGDDYDYFFYRRYEPEAYISELEYTITMMKEILEDGHDYFAINISP